MVQVSLAMAERGESIDPEYRKLLLQHVQLPRERAQAQARPQRSPASQHSLAHHQALNDQAQHAMAQQEAARSQSFQQLSGPGAPSRSHAASEASTHGQMTSQWISSKPNETSAFEKAKREYEKQMRAQIEKKMRTTYETTMPGRPHGPHLAQQSLGEHRSVGGMGHGEADQKDGASIFQPKIVKIESEDPPVQTPDKLGLVRDIFQPQIVKVEPRSPPAYTNSDTTANAQADKLEPTTVKDEPVDHAPSEPSEHQNLTRKTRRSRRRHATSSQAPPQLGSADRGEVWPEHSPDADEALNMLIPDMSHTGTQHPGSIGIRQGPSSTSAISRDPPFSHFDDMLKFGLMRRRSSDSQQPNHGQLRRQGAEPVLQDGVPWDWTSPVWVNGERRRAGSTRWYAPVGLGASEPQLGDTRGGEESGQDADEEMDMDIE